MQRRDGLRYMAGGAAGWTAWALRGATVGGGALLSACAAPRRSGPVTLDPALAPADLAWLNRVSYGATTASAARLAQQGRAAWLDRELDPRGADAPLPEAIQGLIDAMDLTRRPMEERVLDAERRRREADDTPGDEARQAARQAYQQDLNRQAREAGARFMLRAVYSERQVQELLTWFWFNHFNVHQYKHNLRLMVGDYEAALRRQALGRFRDLLGTATWHPAMLRYLDNEQNAARKINENLARELMELHTLGVDGGYSQADVQELARVLTGLGVHLADTPPKVPPRQADQLVQRGLTVFQPQRHDPGDKRVLGQMVKGGRGVAEIEEVLDRLAAHPATARHVCQRLARYFVADEPPPVLVERMARRWLQTDGRIAAVMRTMLESEEFEASLGSKFKDPVRYVASAVRLAFEGKPILNPQPMLSWLYRLGEAPYNRQTPDGYPLDEAAWASPGQLATRFEVARLLGYGSAGLFKTEGPAPRERPAFPRLANALYDRSWAPTLGPATRAALEEAQSPQEWNALFLASPEFMRC